MANFSKLRSSASNVALALAITGALAACGDNNRRNNAAPAAVVGNTFAVTTTGRLLNFNRTSGGIQTATQITGLGTDTVIGFDIRPADNSLIVVGRTNTTGRIYNVDPNSGAATLLSTITDPATMMPLVMQGSTFGADFNPVPDRLRLVSDTGQNLRINIATGAATVDGTLTLRNGPTATGVTEVGYSSNFGNACRTQLFYLDTTNNRLLTTNAPNDGIVTIVGSFGVQTSTAVSSFEIITNTMNQNTASVVLTVAGTPTAYSLNLTTGAVSGAAPITGLMSGENLVGIAAATTAVLSQAPGNVVGITASNRIYTFDAGGPTKVCTGPIGITGLTAGTTILGADFRPSNNLLYVLGRTGNGPNQSRLFVVDPVTGAVDTSTGMGPFVLTTLAGAGQALGGTTFGVDFNPATDLLRVVNNAQVNLSVDPSSGVTTPQTAINVAMGAPAAALAGAGYTNSIGPLNPASTTLFTIDAAARTLNIQNPAGSGNQLVVGSLGLPANTVIREFDINGANNQAFLGTQTMAVMGAMAPPPTTTTLFTVNLATGATVSQGVLGSGMLPTALGEAVTAIAIRPPQQTLFGITASNNLVTFGSTAATTGTFTTSVPITGLQGSERLVGIDVRPVDNRLYAATDAGRVYVVDTATGALTAAAPLAANAMLMPMEIPFAAPLLLPGSTTNASGFDFNPVPDRLRIVGSDNQVNLRAVIESGVTFVDTALTKMTPTLAPVSVTSAAYSGSTPGVVLPTATTLYVLDTANDQLFIQNPPNDGVLNRTTAMLGFDATATGGFDIVGRQTALAALTVPLMVGSSNNLYTINLATGAATSVGPIGTGLETVTGLAITPSATDPAPSMAFPVTAVLNGITLVTFSSATPGMITTTVPITGLAVNETVRDIDFRPMNGLLYAFGTQGGVYVIDPMMGIATPAPALNAGMPALPPAAGGMFTAPSGVNFGIDFNPVPDRLRVLSDAGQSLRINVDTGGTLVDRALTTTAPATAGASAYTNNFAGSTATVLFQIDTSSGTLEVQDPADGGMLLQRGRLDPVLTFTKVAGFDIQGGDNGRGLINLVPTTAAGGVALAVLQPSGAMHSTLYRVNLAGNGIVPFALTPIGAIGPSMSPQVITAFAIRLQQ